MRQPGEERWIVARTVRPPVEAGALLLIAGQTSQKTFKGIFKSFKIRTSQMRDVTKRRIALRRNGKSGVRAAYISKYGSHDGHPNIFKQANMTNAPAPIRRSAY